MTSPAAGSGPDAGQLRAMQDGDYILLARGGELVRVPVRKTRLPLDPVGHVQRLNFAAAPDGTLYAAQHSLWHRSTDGGETWTHLERSSPGEGWRLQFAPDGSMVNVGPEPGGGPAVWSSSDEGESWRRIGGLDAGVEGARLDLGFSVTRLPCGALLVPLLVVEGEEDDASPGSRTCHVYRSDDGGRNWERAGTIGEWCHEVNLTLLPDGRLLAVIRYQRPRLPEDPEDGDARDPGWPYKHVFLSHSRDDGATWEPPRQLCTVYGQCYGAAGVLPDNTVAVVHDHRYPRSMASGRARVSRDGGDSFGDGVYYLVHGYAAGYAATLSPDGESFLTLTGSCYADVDSGWDAAIGTTRFVLIRWRPVD